MAIYAGEREQGSRLTPMPLNDTLIAAADLKQGPHARSRRPICWEATCMVLTCMAGSQFCGSTLSPHRMRLSVARRSRLAGWGKE